MLAGPVMYSKGRVQLHVLDYCILCLNSFEGYNNSTILILKILAAHEGSTCSAGHLRVMYFQQTMQMIPMVKNYFLA